MRVEPTPPSQPALQLSESISPLSHGGSFVTEVTPEIFSTPYCTTYYVLNSGVTEDWPSNPRYYEGNNCTFLDETAKIVTSHWIFQQLVKWYNESHKGSFQRYLNRTVFDQTIVNNRLEPLNDENTQKLIVLVFKITCDWYPRLPWNSDGKWKIREEGSWHRGKGMGGRNRLWWDRKKKERIKVRIILCTHNCVT